MRRDTALILCTAAMLCMSGCDATSSDGGAEGRITMPDASSSYIGSEWTLESLEGHFRDLGFSDFEERPLPPNDDDYMDNIFNVEARSLLFAEDPWDAGDGFDPDTTIVISYNEKPMLTTGNSPELAAMVECADGYDAFAEEYDGYYASFDAVVSFQYSSSTTLSDILMVSGGNYETNQMNDWTIYIGDRSSRGDALDMTLPVGTPVHVEGRIDLDWSRYFDQLYVEGIVLRAL